MYSIERKIPEEFMQTSGSSGALSRQSIFFSSRTCGIKIYNGTNHTVCYWSIPADVHFSVYIPVTISWPYWDEFCYQVERVKEDPSLASVLDKDTEKVLPMTVCKFIEERTERIPRGRGGPNWETLAPAGWTMGFQDKAFIYSSRWVCTDGFDWQL